MSGILVIGHLDLLQDDPQDILRKRIEKIDAILVVKLIPPGVRTDTADALFVLRRQFGILNILNCLLTKHFIVLYACRAASRPRRHEK